jgi:hypothetical protein
MADARDSQDAVVVLPSSFLERLPSLQPTEFGKYNVIKEHAKASLRKMVKDLQVPLLRMGAAATALQNWIDGTWTKDAFFSHCLTSSFIK